MAMAPVVPPTVRGRVAWPAVTVAVVSPGATVARVWSVVIEATAPPEEMAAAAWREVIAAAARSRGTVSLAEWRPTVRSVLEKEPAADGSEAVPASVHGLFDRGQMPVRRVKVPGST